MALLAMTTFVVVTSLSLARRLERRSIPTMLLIAYVLAYGEIVLVTLGLSSIDALGRSGYLAATAAIAVAAVIADVVWRVPAPPWRQARAALGEALASVPVAVVGVVAALSSAYAAVLGVFTPPNDDDAITYHLTRAALWLQEGGVRYLEGIDDIRVNGFMPGAEMLSAFTLAGAGSDRWVWAPQMAAVGALAVGALAIARRIGLDRREALFGALLVPCFPIVALQSQSALNDLPTAALLVTVTALGLRGSRAGLAVASLAVALALLTKFSAIVVLPVVAAILVVAAWPRVTGTLAALGAGIVLGSGWYLVNLSETGSVFGFTDDDVLERSSRAGSLREALSSASRMTADVFRIPGASGRDQLLFAVAGALLVAAVLVRRRSSGNARQVATAALLVALTPLLLVIGELVSRGTARVWWELGDEDSAAFARRWDGGVAVQNVVSMGAVGAVVGVAAAVMVARAVRRGAMPWLALLLVVAPLAQIVILAIALDRNPWLARFAIAAWTLSAATWGTVLRVRVLELAVPAIAATSMLLLWVHYADKPSGARLLEPRTGPSALTQPDWRVQATRSGIEPVLRFLHEEVAHDASVAVWPASFPDGDEYHEIPDLVPYVVYGGRLGRTLHQARSVDEAERDGATWYLAPTPSLRVACAPGWTVRFETESGWTALERTPGSSCPNG